MKNWLTLSLLLGLGGAASAQNEVISRLNLDKKVIGPAPSVSSLNRYDDIPVNFSTGAISISIPIFSISYKGLDLPITLNYSNNGIKVNEEAEIVGLGWSLSAGGHISREIRGLPDESWDCGLIVDLSPGFTSDFQACSYDPDAFPPNFTDRFDHGLGYCFLGQNTKQFCTTGNPGIDIGEYMYFGSYGFWDTEPDKFSFNIPTASGEFVFDGQGSIQQFEQSPILIIPDIGQDYLKFRIKDTRGYTYYFEGTDYVFTKTYSYNYVGPTNNTNPYGLYSIPTSPSNCSLPECSEQIMNGFSKVTTFYLTKIENESGIKVCEFKYHSVDDITTSISDASVTQSVYNGAPASFLGSINEFTTTKNQRKQLMIDAIIWPEGSVLFNYDQNNPREDVGDAMDEAGSNYPLKSIIVKNYLGELIKEMEFSYEYFTANAGSTNPHEKRLKLVSVTEKNGSEVLPSYYFSYNPIILPSKNSFEQDYYGFYRPYTNDLLTSNSDPSFQRYLKLYMYPGDTNNSIYGNTVYSIYPRTSHQGPEYILNGESREPDGVYGQAGLLTSIKYPTGGADNFTYEPHSFVLDGIERSGGGFRIQKIERHFGNGAPNKVTTFKYIASSGASSGKLLSLPDFGKIYFDSYAPNEPTGSWTYIDAVKNTIRHFQPSSQLLAYAGSHVMYERIEVLEAGNGKMVYEYNIPVHQETAMFGNFNGSPIYERTESERFEYSQGIATEDANHQLTFHPPTLNFQGKPNHNFPYAPHPNTNWVNGDLVSTTVYSESGNIISKTENQYEIKDVKKIYGVKINHFRMRQQQYYDVYLGNTYLDDIIFRRFDQYFGRYYYLSGWKVLTQTKNITYDQSGSITAVKEYKYEYNNPSHKQRTRIVENGSKGEMYETHFRYPQDYSLPTTSTIPEIAGLIQLQQRNIVRPIESINRYVENNNSYVLSGHLHTFNVGSNNIVFLEKAYELELSQPVSSISPTTYSSSFNVDAAFKLKDVFKYDNFNNLIQISSTNNYTTTFVWGYLVPGNTGPLYPIARVINAPANKTKFINFEWEPSSLSNSNNAHTGRKSRSGNFTITASTNGPISGTYRLSYWEDLGNEWKFKTSIINYNPSNGYTISTNGTIDDISLVPNEAIINSFTYTPLRGITSVSSDNYTPTHYEYDLLGRLKRIQDLNRNIISLIEYHYKP